MCPGAPMTAFDTRCRARAPERGGDSVGLGLSRVHRVGYACLVMPGPFVDDSRVAQARGIASEVIEPVFDLIRRHTTVSVERTVLRLFGMADAGPGGVPLTNLMTDQRKAAGVLNRGAAYWYGRALHPSAPAPLPTP